MSPVETLQRRWRSSERLRFLVVGGWNTAFGYGLFVALYWLLGTWLHYVAIAMIAHLLAVTQSFVSQRRLVFFAATGWLRQYLRFHVASLAALGINLAVMTLLVEAASLRVLAAQAVATCVSVVATYLMHKHYSFRES
jgi:putative flippase GtrA